MHNALRSNQVGAVTRAGSNIARQLHEVARLLWRFGEKTFEQTLIYVFGKVYGHIVQAGQHRALQLRIAVSGVGLRRHGTQHMRHLQGLGFGQGAGCLSQVVNQTGGGRWIVQIPQVMHHQLWPSAQELDQRPTFCGLQRRGQQGIFHHMNADGLQAGKADHLGGLAGALRQAAVLVQRVHEGGRVQVQKGQLVKAGLEVSLHGSDLAGQGIDQIIELHDARAFIKVDMGCGATGRLRGTPSRGA